MGSLAVAFGIAQRLGLECLIHLTTRDRNLMALEADLLGAHALGIRNVLRSPAIRHASPTAPRLRPFGMSTRSG